MERLTPKSAAGHRCEAPGPPCHNRATVWFLIGAHPRTGVIGRCESHAGLMRYTLKNLVSPRNWAESATPPGAEQF